MKKGEGPKAYQAGPSPHHETRTDLRSAHETLL